MNQHRRFQAVRSHLDSNEKTKMKAALFNYAKERFKEYQKTAVELFKQTFSIYSFITEKLEYCNTVYDDCIII